MERAGEYPACRQPQVPHQQGTMSPTVSPGAQSGTQVPVPPPPLTWYSTPSRLWHTVSSALKFNQMLNYILTWVPTSWLYSPASD